MTRPWPPLKENQRAQTIVAQARLKKAESRKREEVSPGVLVLDGPTEDTDYEDVAQHACRKETKKKTRTRNIRGAVINRNGSLSQARKDSPLV